MDCLLNCFLCTCLTVQFVFLGRWVRDMSVYLWKKIYNPLKTEICPLILLKESLHDLRVKNYKVKTICDPILISAGYVSLHCSVTRCFLGEVIVTENLLQVCVNCSLQGRRSGVCSTLCRSRTRNGKWCCFWLRTRTLRTPRCRRCTWAWITIQVRTVERMSPECKII